jgi:hypothetical protein
MVRKMISFWRSVDRLATEGLKVAWLGVGISVTTQLVDSPRWIFWIGSATTIVGLVLRQRAEHLRRVLAAPRRLLHEEKSALPTLLGQVPKAPIEVQFMGHDSETEQFANQLRTFFGLPVSR